MFATMTSAFAGQMTLAWDPVANATGYKVHYGTSSTSYAASVDAKTATSYTLTNLADGVRYYFAVTSYNGTTESSYSNQISATVPVAGAPAASFTASPTTGVAPLAVTLTDTSTGTISSRSWNLGDGTTSSSQTVAKSYSSPGTYTVTLTVTGSGGSTTASKTITVSAAAPVASFSATPVSGSSPLTVAFTDGSSGSVTAWAWDFGDGGTSTSRSPSHTYSAAGTYSVTLTVTGPSGSNKLTKAGLISVSAPVSSGTSTPTPTPTAPASSSQGLVAAFGFEETSGRTLYDASGNGNHGTLSGARRVTGKPFGRAVRFDGADDFVTIPDSNSLDLASGVTLQAWVYPTASMTGWRTVLVKERSGTPVYSLYANGDGQRPATIVETGGAERVLSAGGALPVKQWTHLASTYDGANQKLYVNGVLVGSRPQTGTISLSGGALRIAGNSVWGEYFAGFIDEVRVYNRALSQAEIAADANRAVVALQMSTSGTRASPVPLHGQAVSGNIYIFYADLGPSSGKNPVKQVKFWLNDPQPATPTGAPRMTENVAPFDFAGTATDGTAMPLNTAALPKGTHTVSARAVLSDGTALPVRVGTFVVP
jgi:PKD repeat protein